MLTISDLRIAVGHADVIRDMAFSGSMDLWLKDEPAAEAVTKQVPTDLIEPVVSGDQSIILIGRDCLADVSVSDRSLIHIYGDLRANINVNGRAEIVIAGDCHPEASINLNGGASVFIGGNLHGRIASKGSAAIWVNENCDGVVSTGTPSTHLFVMGDMFVSLPPTGKPSLLYLVVGGFMSYRILEETANYKYTQFNATVGISDCSPGIHPSRALQDRLRQQRRFVRWVNHNLREGNGNS